MFGQKLKLVIWVLFGQQPLIIRKMICLFALVTGRKFDTYLIIILHIGSVSKTATVLLSIPESGLFVDFVKRLKHDSCFHG